MNEDMRNHQGGAKARLDTGITRHERTALTKKEVGSNGCLLIRPQPFL